MGSNATINARIMSKKDRRHFEPGEEVRDYLESLSAAELRQLASYARKMAAGKEDRRRKPGSEGGRWLSAQYVRGFGPYFYLKSYRPGNATYTNDSGRMISGNEKVRYVGRHLPADLAGEFGYPAGATPEETGIHIGGTPRSDTPPGGKRSSG